MSTQYFNSQRRSTRSLPVILSAILLAVGTQANAAEADAVSQPKQLVQSFVETMDYSLLSDADKAVWDEQTWEQIQSSAAQSNQVRLADGHPFHQLESLVRGQVTITALDAEPADDGSVRVTTEMTYPYVLMLIDDYIETQNSYAYEQLSQYNRALADERLDVAELDVHRSTMPWRVQDGGVFVNAAEMQENREALQAQGW